MMLAYRSAHANLFFAGVLGIKSAAAKIVPKLINFEQKQRRMDIAQKMMTMI